MLKNVHTGYIEQLLQETIKQCKKGGGDLSEKEEEPKPLCSAFGRPDKALPYNSTKVDLVLLSLYYIWHNLCMHIL